VNNEKKRHSKWPLYSAFIILLLVNAGISFALADTARGKELSEYEKSVLFTEEGYCRFPPSPPGESQKSLGLWELPLTELEFTEEKILSTTLSSGNIELLDGWNYISFPKKLNPSGGHDQGGYVFAGVDTGGRSIFYYNSYTGLWEWVTSSTIIKPLVGYCVYSVGPFTLMPDYLPKNQQTNPSKDLYFGWNLIGYFDPMGNYADDYLHAAMARDLMASLGSDWSMLRGWDASSQQYETSITRYEDYRLTYPKKGYWLWMNADRYLTYPVTHTYTCSAEWVNDYHGQQATLYTSDDVAIGFYNSLDSDPNWHGSFIIGDNDGYAQETHWKEPTDSGYIDNTHFALFAGHGSYDRIVFYHPTDENQRSLYYSEADWGNGKVDWIALHACSVLYGPYHQNWKNSFNGLHSIVGWHSEGYSHVNLGTLFASRLKIGDSIWEAWQYAGKTCAPSQYSVAIIAVDVDGNQYTRDCIDDHIYTKGSWMSPMGNPSSNQFVYASEPC